MPNVTAICYLCSLLFFGMGYSKTLLIKNAITAHLNTSDYTAQVTLATSYYVLTILFALIGSFLFYVKHKRERDIIELHNGDFRVKADRRWDDERRLVSISAIKAQLAQSEYGLDLDRRLSS